VFPTKVGRFAAFFCFQAVRRSHCVRPDRSGLGLLVALGSLGSPPFFLLLDNCFFFKCTIILLSLHKFQFLEKTTNYRICFSRASIIGSRK
jgi:hypothetical protein